jgi:hypothetical protein
VGDYLLPAAALTLSTVAALHGVVHNSPYHIRAVLPFVGKWSYV